MLKKPFKIGFKIFIGSILTYNAFLNPQMALGSSITEIQTTAMQETGGNRLLYYGMNPPASNFYEEYNFFRATSTGLGGDGQFFTLTDNTTCYNISSTTRFWILQYYTGTGGAYFKYNNQNGTERTPSARNNYFFTLNGLLFSLGSTYSPGELGWGSDTCFKNIRFNPSNATWVGFALATSTDLSYINTQQEALDFIDILNSNFYKSIYTPISSNSAEIFEILSPTNATTTSSVNVNFKFTFYNPNNQVDKFEVFLQDKIVGGFYNYTEDLPVGEFGIASKDIMLPTGTYRATISLFSSSTPDLLRSSKTINTINVNYDPTSIIGVNNTNNLIGLATTTCSITNIAGCMQNALLFVFYPNDTVLDLFSDLKGLVENKPPFAYVTIYGGQLASLSDNTTPTFELASEDNINDLIFTPIKDGLSNVIWICFGFWFLNRIRKQEL